MGVWLLNFTLLSLKCTYSSFFISTSSSKCTFTFERLHSHIHAVQTVTSMVNLLSVIHKAAFSSFCRTWAWSSQPALSIWTFHAAPPYWDPGSKPHPWGSPGPASQPSCRAGDNCKRGQRSLPVRDTPLPSVQLGPEHGNVIPLKVSLACKMCNG